MVLEMELGVQQEKTVYHTGQNLSTGELKAQLHKGTPTPTRLRGPSIQTQGFVATIPIQTTTVSDTFE